MNDTVLVTGGTGFVGAWCAVDLLNRGHRVRTTVRDLAAEQRVRGHGGRRPGDGRGTSSRSWRPTSPRTTAGRRRSRVSMRSSTSPSPMVATREEEAVIRPAVDGVVRILRAARDAG